MPYLDLPPDLKLFYKVDDYTDPWAHPETVIFIHGANENTEAWRAWMPHLSRRYRLIRYDQRGFGKSGPVSADFVYTTALFVDDLVRVINRLSVQPVHVIAAKSGGISAVHLAATRPDLVKTVTLASTPIKFSTAHGLHQRMQEQGMRGWVRSSMTTRMGSKMPPRGIDWWVDLMGNTAMSTMQAYFRWVSVIDLTAELQRIACPVLTIISGASTRGQSDLEVYRKCVADLEAVVLPLEGYHVSGANPDGCARAALDFLGRHTQS